MQPAHSSFYQPPPNNPNLPPNSYPQNPNLPFSQPINQTPVQTLQSTSSVPFATLSDPIIPFDALDHSYPPEKFLSILGARVTFQLGPQPIDPQEYLI